MWRKDSSYVWQQLPEKHSQPFLFGENVAGQWNLVKSVGLSIGN